MRFLHIFLLHNQQIFEQRTKSFVWFLGILLNPLIMLILWGAAFKSGTHQTTNWNFSYAASYYFLLIIAGSLLMPHTEEVVSKEDIQEGQLTKYVIRPFPYYWFKYFEEIPYRLLLGLYGLIIFIVALIFYQRLFIISQSWEIIVLSIVSSILAYHLTFNLKISLGLIAFWTTDIVALINLVEIIILVFAGFVMPLDLLPSNIANLIYMLPFPYMIYFPVIAFQGKLSLIQLMQLIVVQSGWVLTTTLLYIYIWNKGIKKFTSFGQ